MAKKKVTRKSKSPSIAEMVKSEVKAQMPVVDVGVAVALPNTTDRKMTAISDLARAVRSLANSLESTNVHVNISDVVVTNTEAGINVSTKAAE